MNIQTIPITNCFILKRYKRVQDLSTEMCGVLVTTGGREKQCVAEAYDLFNNVRSCSIGYYTVESYFHYARGIL